MIACSKLGMHFVACTTKEYFPNEELVETCKGYAAQSGATITLTEDVKEGTKDADVIYTDVWVSMGEPERSMGEENQRTVTIQSNKRSNGKCKGYSYFPALSACIP